PRCFVGCTLEGGSLQRRRSLMSSLLRVEAIKRSIRPPSEQSERELPRRFDRFFVVPTSCHNDQG
ncbi:hypothetical protein ABTK93_21285, partial [Acinetobacter baumannii]